MSDVLNLQFMAAIETGAEGGLLARNVKVMGNINQQFVTEIPACENHLLPMKKLLNLVSKESLVKKLVLMNLVLSFSFMQRKRTSI